MRKYFLSVRAENKSGVLSKIAGLLRRKLFNIDSLTVGRTFDAKISQFTIVIFGEKKEAEKAAAVIANLVEILSVKILSRPILREIVLARFAKKNFCEKKISRAKILQKKIAENENEIIFEFVDTSQNLENFLKILKKENTEIREWARSGVIAIEK